MQMSVVSRDDGDFLKKIRRLLTTRSQSFVEMTKHHISQDPSKASLEETYISFTYAKITALSWEGGSCDKTSSQSLEKSWHGGTELLKEMKHQRAIIVIAFTLSEESPDDKLNWKK